MSSGEDRPEAGEPERLTSELQYLAARNRNTMTTPEVRKVLEREVEIAVAMERLQNKQRAEIHWRALSDEDRTRLVRDWLHANGPDSWEESERRVQLLADVTDGFCRACGRIRPGGICHCENDE